MMNLLITLLIAHLFADFPLQTNALAQLKERSWYGVLLHVLVHIIVTALLIQDSLYYWPLLLGIGSVHFIIDGFKLLWPAKKGVVYFLIDQFLHIITLVIATYLVQQEWTTTPVSIVSPAWLFPILSGAFIPAVMVLLWLWTNSLSHEFLSHSALRHWTKHQILSIEQGIGIGLFLVVCLQPAFYSFVNVIQSNWR